MFSRNLIHENHVIEKLGNHYQFDYAWQNGTLNLVKPVSFDLLKPESIVNKATRYFGEFTLLEDEADAQQLRFDVLLAKPPTVSFSKPTTTPSVCWRSPAM